MENNLTELVFILDKSGSMYDLRSDTIGGFNSMLDKQKGKESNVFVTTVLFNDEFKRVHDRIDIGEIRPMTERDYCPCGCTALLDAMGDTIKHIENIHRYIRREDVPEKTLFVIITDGMENASVKYDSRKIKRMVERKKEDGWEFLFLGANIDAIAEAERYGIMDDRAVTYRCDSKGTRLNFDAVGEVVKSVRADGAVPVGWKRKIEKHKGK